MTKFDRKTVFRYTAFQIPSLLLLLVILYFLGRFFSLSPLSALLIVAIWILKDILLFPFLSRYYRPSASSTVERLVGREGTVSSDLNPYGYIRLGMELWRAKPASDSDPLQKGDRAVVVSVKGFTLYVKRLSSPGPD